MLEEIFEDNLIGDPNDLEQIIEHQDDNGEEQENEAGNENENVGGNENATADPKKKRVVRNPRPKLDPERLKGPRGISVLENVYKDFKFHGKCYERTDLNRVMLRLEHWAHRLFPRFQFDDCLEKIEKLGQKKPVQVYIKKIRMGIETVEEPMILDDAEEQNVCAAPLDAFDELIGHQLSEARAENQTSSRIAPSTELSSEQRERMLKNQLLAEERRLAMMKAKHEMQRGESDDSTQSPATEGSVSRPTVLNSSSDNSVVHMSEKQVGCDLDFVVSTSSTS